MSTQPPEQNPNDYDEVTRLRLQLNHAEVQRDAFAAALKADVLKVVRVSIIQATIDADEEIARLQDELKMEKENEDRLVREWQKANNEVYGLKTQVAALIDDQTRLKAECQARQAENSVLAVECDSLKAEVERLKEDNRQLTKAFEIAEGIIKRMGKAAEAAAKEGKQS